MIPATIELTLGDKSREIKMSFGLLDELTRIIGDFDNVGLLGLEPELRTKVLEAVLVERDAKGKPTGAVNFFELDIDPETALAMLDWVGAHVADFFLKRMTASKAMLESRQDLIKSLMPSSVGGKS